MNWSYWRLWTAQYGLWELNLGPRKEWCLLLTTLSSLSLSVWLILMSFNKAIMKTHGLYSCIVLYKTILELILVPSSKRSGGGGVCKKEEEASLSFFRRWAFESGLEVRLQITEGSACALYPRSRDSQLGLFQFGTSISLATWLRMTFQKANNLRT